MELGRDCLKLWGYDRVDELIWVKTNQLQRIIRTGLKSLKEKRLKIIRANPRPDRTLVESWKRALLGWHEGTTKTKSRPGL